MIVLAGLLAILAAGVAAVLREGLIKDPPTGLMVENFRGRRVPAIGGVVVLSGFLAAEAVLTVAALSSPGSLDRESLSISPSALAVTFGSTDHVGILVVVLGFFCLGMLDDLGGAGRAKGFRGHIRALRDGRVTGGSIKAIGGAVVAFAAAAQWGRSLQGAVVDGAIVALTANLFNLLDTRPGRTVKVQMLAWAPAAAVGWSSPWFPLSAAVVAASAVWLPADLRERGMLGDGGANLIGAVLGAGFALTLGPAGRYVCLSVLVLLTALSEGRSFSSIIDRVAVLRWFDRLGRARE